MSKLYVAKSQNLSVAWTEVFNHLMQPGVIAQQMGLHLTQVTCIASSLKLPSGDGYTKSGLAPLKHSLNQILELHQQKAA